VIESAEGVRRISPLPLPYGFASVRRMVPSESKAKPKLTAPCEMLLNPAEGTPLLMGKSMTGGFSCLALTTREAPLVVKEIWAGPTWSGGGVVRFSLRLMVDGETSPEGVILKQVIPFLAPPLTTHSVSFHAVTESGQSPSVFVISTKPMLVGSVGLMENIKTVLLPGLTPKR